MHEVSIAHSLLELVMRSLTEGGFGRVTRIAVKVGRLSAVIPESLEFAFRAAARGTPAEAAELEIEEVDGWAQCRKCGARFATDSFYVVCEECGAGDVEVSGGDDLVLDNMDVER